jgi:hypothetical protein
MRARYDAVVQPMSALPPKADIDRHDGHVRLLPIGDLSRCSNRHDQLLDQLVRKREHIVGNFYAEGLCSLEVDDQLKFG